MSEYPVNLTPAEEGGFVVTFPDVPEAITQGDTRDEALLAAKDALARRLHWHMPQVDRLLDLGRASKFSQVEQAAALGKRALLEVKSAA